MATQIQLVIIATLLGTIIGQLSRIIRLLRDR